MQKEALKKKELKTPFKLQIDELLAVISAFSNLLKKENSALKSADFNAVDKLQADKKIFAKQYEAKVHAIADRRDELLNLDSYTREKLMNERIKFNEVLDLNMTALEMAQESNKRLVNLILDSARKAVAQDKQTNYSNAGLTTTYKSATSSLSIDEVL